MESTLIYSIMNGACISGRLLGAGTFLALAYGISTEIALRYAVIIIAVLQLCSIFVAKKIIAQGKIISPAEPEVDSRITGEMAEALV